MKVILQFLGITVITLLLNSQSEAAQDSTIVIDNAIIRSEPRDNADVLEYLSIGTEVRISNYPVQGGWYKVRARTGEYGWIHEAYLSVSKLPETVTPEKTKIKAYKSEADEEPAPKKVPPKPVPDRKKYVRASFGYQFQGAADINDVFGFSEFSTANYAGFEAGYQYKPKWTLMFRVEEIFSDVVAKENITGVTFNIGLRAYPVMVGLDYFLLDTPPLRISAGAFGGIAFKTSFTTQAINLSAPNTVTLDSSPFTALLRLNVTRPLGRTFAVFAEAGYRYLVTGELSTAAAKTTNGGQIYVKNSAYQNRIIDYSGFTLGAGLGVHF